MSDQAAQDRTSRANLRKLKELLHKSENRICADCDAPDPRWAYFSTHATFPSKHNGLVGAYGVLLALLLQLALPRIA